jgi:hypothetical protein
MDIGYQRQMFRWEAFDFDKQRVHVSCPICFRLTRTTIDAIVTATPITCAHADCTFSALIECDEEGRRQYHKWKARAAASTSGLVDRMMWSG